MSLKPVRTYLKSRLSDSDSSYKEHKDGFNRDNIPRTSFNKSYHIAINSVDNISNEGGYVESSVSTRVELFFKGFRNIQTAIDDSIDKANDVKLRASNPANWTSTIKGVVCDSISAETLETNDNVVIMIMEFTITTAQAVV